MAKRKRAGKDEPEKKGKKPSKLRGCLLWFLGGCFAISVVSVLVAPPEEESEVEQPLPTRIVIEATTPAPTATEPATQEPQRAALQLDSVTQAPTAIPTEISVLPALVFNGDNDIVLAIERFQFLNEIGDRDPSRDFFLTVYGTLYNYSRSRECVRASRLGLDVDDDSYSPDNSAMDAMKKLLDPPRDFIGAYNGQCIEAGESQSTFAVFDTRLGATTVSLGFDRDTQQIDMDWPVEGQSIDGLEFAFGDPAALVIAAAPSATATPSATWTPEPSATELPTITVTPSATITDTPVGPTRVPVTAMSSTRYYVRRNANIRQCASTDNNACPVIGTLAGGQMIMVSGSVVGDQVSGDGVWYRIDYLGETAYIHRSLVSENAPATAAPAPASSGESTGGSNPPPVAGPAFTCNCSKVCSAMVSCEEAYFQLNTCGCSDRDGDGDGVPCEKLCPGG